MKINKNLIILSLLLIFCISLGAVSAADNADISVNDMFDDSNNQVNIGFTKDTSISAVEIKGSNTVSNNGYAQTDELENNTSTDSNNNPSQPDNVLLISDSFNGANIMSLGVSSSIVYISTTGNDTTGDGSFANPVASLERALDIVPTNGQIIFKNGTYYPNNVAINKNVTITGMGEVILSGNSTNRILNIAKGTVTISNLIFKDGNVTFDDGGAIYVDSSASLIISDNNTFINNRASYDGGAIYSRGSLVVSGFNISFVNCSAGGYGGAIESSGSVVINSNNLIFINNTAGTYGGAIYFISGSGFVNYCIFDNNTAKSGSAIYINGGSVNVDYNFFGFQNNVTKFPSDLIYGAPPIKWVVLDIVKSGGEYVVKFVDNDGYDLDDFMPDYVVSLTINDEDAKEITIKNNTFKDNLVIGFYKLNSINTGNLLAETNFEIPNDSFTALNELIINSKDNTIVLDHDYKFYDDFDGDFIDGIVIDKNITIDGNNHTINGLNLARVFSVTANNVTIKNLTFVNCSANDDYGGAIYWYGACGSVESCSFVNCTAYAGGAIHIRDECNVSVVGCSFVNCSSSFGSAIYFYSSVGSVVGCSFVNCSSIEYGSPIVWQECDYGSVVGCSFVNCAADRGGAISLLYGNYFVNNCSFVNCSSSEFGGAIYFRCSVGLVSNCSFMNCSSSSWGGGAIHVLDECNVSVVGCSFVNCTAVEGGAIYFGASVGLVSNCSFVNCTAVEGGAIYFGGSGSVGNVSGCSFVNCSAEEYGGAIHVFSEGSGSVVGCSFVNCTASKWGGAISFVGYGSVVGCSFMNCNTTFVGGAIYCAEGGVANCSFIGCSAIDSSSDDTIGGAILISNGSVVGCSFVGCSASNGGAIGIYNGSVNYCIFDNNNNAVNGRNIAIMDVDLPYSVNIDYNFFTFQNNLTTFPDNLIVIIKNKEVTSIYPNNWVVLDIVKSGGNYLVKFVLNDCSDLNNVMYDYNASLTINGENPYEITIKDNTFKGQFIEGSYLLTSSNSDIVLVNTTLNLTVPIYEIDVWDCEYGETAIINIIFKEEGVTGEIIVKISDNYIITRTINDKNRVSIPINGLSPGNHVLNISYSGNGAYLPFNTSATVIVSGSSEFDMNISVNDTLYGEVTYVVVNLPDDAIGYVEL